MICLDASLVASIILPEGEMSRRAASLTRQWISDGEDFIAPDLWAYEVVSIVFKAIGRGRLPADRGPLILQENFGFPITLVPPPSYERAYELAVTLNLPAPYEAHYLALAEAEGIEFWTGDKQLYERVKSALAWVHSVGEESM